jgi:flagella synthesis protein FlgN
MTESALSADFIPRLVAEREALTDFVMLLKTEQQALIEGQSDQLLALSELKTSAVQTLSKLANSRKIDMAPHTAAIQAAGITAWLQAHAPGSLSPWQEVQQLAEQLQQLNRTNGMLIQTKLRLNQQALTVLHSAATNSNALYGADGQPHLSSSGRILGTV